MPHQTAHPTPADPGPPGAAEPSPGGAPGERERGPARRSVVTLGAAAVGATAAGVAGTALLAGCGSGASGSVAAAGTAGAGAPVDPTTGSSASLAKLAEVPVGGAHAATGPAGQPIVIARPSASRVVAFSALCTHQGCKVLVYGAMLDCPCHGSRFDALTGRVLRGPARSPLRAVAVTVSGPDVVAG